MDSEELSDSLKIKRFIIKTESVEGMSIVKDTLKKLGEQYPYLSGIGFFGSRVKGTDSQVSDFDICVFYNSDRMDPDMRSKDDWREITETLEKELGIKIDRHILDPSGGLRINLSEKSTLKQIEMFVQAAESIVGQDVNIDTLLKEVGIPPVQDLYSRFFLAVGDEVYKNRKFILDELEKKKQGDDYLRILMRSLASFERGNDPSKVNTPQYEGYPKTIEEARDYFNLP